MHPILTGTYSVYVSESLLVDTVDYVADLDVGIFTMTVTPPEDALVDIRYQHTYLSDADITAMLTLEGNVDKLAAAQALGIIASSEVLIQKVITILDLKTEGDRVAKELRARAEQLKAEVMDDGAFGWAEVPMDLFAEREELLRDATE